MKIINIFIVFVLFAFVNSCNFSNKEVCLENLENRLSAMRNSQNKSGEVINIKDSITCFNWDSLLIESGYASKESIKKFYGLEIPYRFNNSKSDGNALMFFISNNKIVNHIDFRISCENGFICKSYDFRTLIKYNKKSLIPREDAVFEVYIQELPNSNGYPLIRENAIRLIKI